MTPGGFGNVDISQGSEPKIRYLIGMDPSKRHSGINLSRADLNDPLGTWELLAWTCIDSEGEVPEKNRIISTSKAINKAFVWVKKTWEEEVGDIQVPVVAIESTYIGFMTSWVQNHIRYVGVLEYLLNHWTNGMLVPVGPAIHSHWMAHEVGHKYLDWGKTVRTGKKVRAKQRASKEDTKELVDRLYARNHDKLKHPVKEEEWIKTKHRDAAYEAVADSISVSLYTFSHWGFEL
jgi:hypothetical protein